MPTTVPDRSDATTGARSADTGSGRSFTPPRGTGRTAARIGVLTVCQAALMVGIGLLITGPAKSLWPLTAEDDVNEGFEHIRTGTWNTVSFVASEAGNTITVVAVTLLSCLGLILIPRLPKWREAVFLAVGVSLQSLVFLAITESVDRHRPEVDRLDASPPTSSYTSGHTGAATALYAGLAVLALSRMRGPWRKIVGALLLLLPLIVAVARLYRGMHHPTDVLGGMANGGLSLLIVGRALFVDRSVTAAPSRAAVPAARTADETAPGQERRPGTTAVVLNPTVTDAAAREKLRETLERHGHREPVFLETTADDPGAGQARRAIDDGADVVVVCGGDGTVRAVADAMAGSGVPLAIVPAGTGNLLARNLGLPLSPTEALDAALTGRPRPLDLGSIEGDDLPAACFAAMAGAGLDAAMMEHADPRAKARLGWPAYILAGIGTLRTPRMRLTLRLDDAPAVRRTARMVLVGNVGTVQGGMTLLPDARPDDGRLDLLVLDPRGPAGWLRALRTLARRGSAPSRPDTVRTPAAGEDSGSDVPVEFFTFERADLTFDTPQSRELDGDPVGAGRRLTVRVRPGALTVLLPSRET
ncbi:diacylglycerol kinase family protein [Streptomyces sp. NPDC048566]|uniref:diacylglycerol kinase family protein n=1 Tax=Streptomyces sp. NPDC048566 TaxID=3365569 RepID=UPI0037177257